MAEQDKAEQKRKNSDIHILIAEDEAPLRDLLRISLVRAGYTVHPANDGQEALEIFDNDQISLVLTDVMMPRLDGFELCSELRKRSDVPIVMLTALNRPDDIVRGFEFGADDYITKPFTFREVEARLLAILRRISWLEDRPQFKIISARDVRINEETNEVTVRGKALHLTPIEFQLLRYLMVHADRPVKKETLFREVWGYDLVGGTNLVEVAMRRLREKVEANPSQPDYLVTVRGLGYKFQSTSTGDEAG
jgi:DNA-binding response OmpR family regulator